MDATLLTEAVGVVAADGKYEDHEVGVVDGLESAEDGRSEDAELYPERLRYEAESVGVVVAL